MAPFVEKTFPRGGRKPALSTTSKNSRNSLFKKPKKKFDKAKKKKETAKGSKKITNSAPLNLNDSLDVKDVEDLKPNVIQEGMLLLGIVNRVTNQVVNMTLPGGIQGVVNISDVSEFYVNLVKNDLDVPILQEIFKVGDSYPVKVLSPSESSYNMFNATTDPKKINSKLNYNSIEEGFILIGNVKSEEDHGYVIDFGIEETRGFLHHSRVENGCKLQIGQIIKCAVVERILSHGSCNVQVTMSPRDLKLASISKNSKLPIHCFIPGFQFKVSVKKVMNHGLQINYRKDNSCKGFVHEDYLPDLFPKLDTYLNSERLSTLLYVKPFVNFPFFMVHSPKSFEWHYQCGDIVSGTVVKTIRKGVWFRIGDNSTLTKCFVPLSQLPESKKINEEKEDIYALYPVGKQVSQVRLGRTDLMRRYYVGAADKASLKEKYFSINDIHCGDVIPCQITHIEGKRATVQIGRGIIGHVNTMEMTDVPLKNPQVKFKPGQNVKARVLEVIDGKVIALTMKPTLVKSKDPILKDYRDAKIGDSYTGTLVKIYPNGLLIAFFNRVKGYLSKKDTSFGDGESLEDNFTEGQLIKCYIAATDHETKLLLTLNPFGENQNDPQLKVGKKYKVKVLTVGKDFLSVNVEIKTNKWAKGIIPNQLLSKHHHLGPAYLETFKEGDTFEAYCVYKSDDSKKPKLSPADVFGDFYEATPRKELKNLLQVDTILPFIFKYKDSQMNAFHFSAAIPGYGGTDVVAENKTNDKWSLLKFTRCQIVYGKIKDVDENIKISIKLDDVWDKEIQSSLSFLDNYIIDMERLIERQKTQNKKYLKKITLGQEVTGNVKEVHDNGALIKISSATDGYALGKFSENESVTGKVVWIDGAKKRVYINTQKECVADINKDQSATLELEEDSYYRGRVVYIDKYLTIAALKGRGSGKLVFLPCTRHLNDFFPLNHVYKIGNIINVHVTKLNSGHLLGIDHDVYRIQTKKAWKDSVSELKKSVKNLKRKNKNKSENETAPKKNCKVNDVDDIEIVDEKLNESVVEIKQEIDDEEDLQNFKNDFKKINGGANHEVSDGEVEIKSEDESEINLENDEEKNNKKKKKNKNKKNSSLIENLLTQDEIKSETSDDEEDNEGESNKEKIDLSSSSEDETEDENEKVENTKDVAISKVGFTWDVLKNPDLLSATVAKEEESSDDEEEDEEESKNKQKKNKKMTENEKRELAKREEERLRRIEQELMDTNREPQNVDDFDRAVLAKPDSSALWLKYMAFHLQATEIEKARAVARRALKNISFREEQEKLNIWTALLNLENLYGNDETFNRTRDEALQLNDSYKIQLHILNMYAQSNKLQDAERLGYFMLKKYKDQKDVWRDVASVHYSVGKLETARNVLQKALASLEKKDHIELISKFAHLENKYGSSERAQTLYETVLSSFPKRVDVWCAYVDMMVKSKQIELARQVLERATCQSLPPKKMKILFKKFIEFEETHGTTENVEKVREAAVDYIKNVSNLKSN